MRVRAVCPGAALLAFWFERCVQILHHRRLCVRPPKTDKRRSFRKSLRGSPSQSCSFVRGAYTCSYGAHVVTLPLPSRLPAAAELDLCS